MKSDNHNEAITKLPILLPAAHEAEGDGWVCDYGKQPQNGGRLPKRQPVRALPEDALEQLIDRKKRVAFEATFGHTSRQVIDALALAQAARTKDLEEVARLVWKAEASRGELPSAPQKSDDAQSAHQSRFATYLAAASAVRSPLDAVGAALNVGASSSVLILWQKESFAGSQLLPGLLCSNVSQALFAHALFNVAGKWGLGVCRRCRALFSASRTKQTFCSGRCRVAEAMKRYRKKIKSKESWRTQGRKRRHKRTA